MINYELPNYISLYQPLPSIGSLILDFNDLDFYPHRGSDDAVQARLDLGNGLEISVVANKGEGRGLYGNVEDDLYEVAIFDDDGMIPLSISDDVLGWQSPDQVSYLMAKGQVEGIGWVDELQQARKDSREDLELDD